MKTLSCRAGFYFRNFEFYCKFSRAGCGSIYNIDSNLNSDPDRQAISIQIQIF